VPVADLLVQPKITDFSYLRSVVVMTKCGVRVWGAKLPQETFGAGLFERLCRWRADVLKVLTPIRADGLEWPLPQSSGAAAFLIHQFEQPSQIH
jgi:hypothetical protein